MMRSLGLDISTVSVGWAIDTEKGIEGWGVIELPISSLLSVKVAYLVEKFALIKALQPDLLTIEDTYYSFNVKTLKKLCYFTGVVLSQWDKGEPEFVNASKARKVFGIEGKGEGGGKSKRDFIKEEVKRKIKERFDLDIQNDDIADAIVLAHYGLTGRS